MRIKRETSWDHPRVCGKNYAKIYDAVDGTGSPPRVREKPNKIELKAETDGITPACAGKTEWVVHRYHLYWDHPRVCGKNIEEKNQNGEIEGSPPRVREKLS